MCLERIRERFFFKNIKNSYGPQTLKVYTILVNVKDTKGIIYVNDIYWCFCSPLTGVLNVRKSSPLTAIRKLWLRLWISCRSTQQRPPQVVIPQENKQKCDFICNHRKTALCSSAYSSDSHSRYCGDSSLIEADSSLKIKTWKSPCFSVLWEALRADLF